MLSLSRVFLFFLFLILSLVFANVALIGHHINVPHPWVLLYKGERERVSLYGGRNHLFLLSARVTPPSLPKMRLWQSFVMVATLTDSCRGRQHLVSHALSLSLSRVFPYFFLFLIFSLVFADVVLIGHHINVSHPSRATWVMPWYQFSRRSD